MQDKYKIGTIVTGYVTGIKEYGIFVHLDETISGLIHISEISEKFVKNINDFVTMGEIIRVKVIGKTVNNHYQLSIKNLDYRIMKKRGSKIVETPLGFQNLAMNLDHWVQVKKKELQDREKHVDCEKL